MVTVTFSQFKLGSMEADMSVDIFGVGFHCRIRSHMVTTKIHKLPKQEHISHRLCITKGD